MAKIVIAGTSNCSHFSRIELLADQLALNLPNFKIHKIIKQPQEWESWTCQLREKYGWNVQKSPIVWRELVDRGGKGCLIGGPREFQEYVSGYYSLHSDMSSALMQQVSSDNVRYKDAADAEERYLTALSHPTKVCLTRADCSTVYHLIPALISEEVLGPRTEIALTLCDSENLDESRLNGLQMESADLSAPLLRSVSITDSVEDALKGSSVVVILDQLHQEDNESKGDFYQRIKDHFQSLAKLVDTHCHPDAKILVAGSVQTPVNFIVATMHEVLTRIKRYNLVGLARSLERQAKAVLAKKLKVNTAHVVDVVIWGNLAGKKIIDCSRSRVYRYDGAITGPDWFSLSTMATVWDRKWMKSDMEKEACERAARAEKGGLGMAHSVATFLRDWIRGSQPNEIYSLVVESQGWYKVPPGIVFSFPVYLNPHGYWTVVEDMDLSEEMETKLKECADDVDMEKQAKFPQDPTKLNDSLGSTSVDGPQATPSSPLDVVLAELFPGQESQLREALLVTYTVDQLAQLTTDRAEFGKLASAILSRQLSREVQPVAGGGDSTGDAANQGLAPVEEETAEDLQDPRDR